MGKDLRGKELGIGISQRKDGRYTARYVSKRTGKTIQKYFDKLQECRKWYMESKLNDENGNMNIGNQLTVADLFNMWSKQNEKFVKESTSYITKVKFKAVPNDFKNMIITDVRPMNVQNMIIELSEKYSHSTLDRIKSITKTIFEFALDNDFVKKNPVTKRVKVPGYQESRQAMTIEQQKAFLKEFKKSRYYNFVTLILQTGMRSGEITGLQWDCVNFEDREIKINKQLLYLPSKGWYYSNPKTKNSNRIIPMTEEAYQILKNQKSLRQKSINIKYAKNVFLSDKGNPVDKSSVNKLMKRACKRTNIPCFSLHSLRHTFCTRMFECGANPKIMQELMGHSDISTTMKVYTHVTNRVKHEEMKTLEKGLKIV